MPLVRASWAQKTQTICITFVQRWPNVFDVSPALYKSHANVLCLLGSSWPWLITNVVTSALTDHVSLTLCYYSEVSITSLAVIFTLFFKDYRSIIYYHNWATWSRKSTRHNTVLSVYFEVRACLMIVSNMFRFFLNSQWLYTKWSKIHIARPSSDFTSILAGLTYIMDGNKGEIQYTMTY